MSMTMSTGWIALATSKLVSNGYGAQRFPLRSLASPGHCLASPGHCGALATLLVGMTLFLAEPARGAQAAPFKTQTSELHAFASDVAQEAEQSTVRIYSQGRRRALGTIVGANGLILTKASELGSRLSCRLANGKDYPARILAQIEAQDLALLKIDAQNLRPVEWTPAENLNLGRFLISPSAANTASSSRYRSSAPGMGAISVKARSIPVQPGLMGVHIDTGEKEKVIIEQVLPGKGAAAAGLRARDRIVGIDEVPIESFDGLTDALSQIRAGSQVLVTYVRNTQQDVAAVTLGQRNEANDPDWFSGKLSRIRSGFPRAFQHDTPLDVRDCGGPVIDLMGRVIGINIARVTRTSTYALPSKDVQLALHELLRLAGKPLPSRQASLGAGRR